MPKSSLSSLSLPDVRGRFAEDPVVFLLVGLVLLWVSIVILACMGRKSSSRSSLTSGALLRSGFPVDRDIVGVYKGDNTPMVVRGCWRMWLTRRA